MIRDEKSRSKCFFMDLNSLENEVKFFDTTIVAHFGLCTKFRIPFVSKEPIYFKLLDDRTRKWFMMMYNVPGRARSAERTRDSWNERTHARRH